MDQKLSWLALIKIVLLKNVKNACVCDQGCLHVGTLRAQKRGSYPLELEFVRL